MTKEDVKISPQLGQVIERWPHDQKLALGHMLAARATDFKKAYDIGGPVEFVKAFYEMFDKTMASARAKQGEDVSCKKGCHLCCRQNVDVSEPEVLLIVEFCKENNIPIPKERLLSQLKYGIKEVARTEEGWCVFLKGKECGIYDVRPMACRKYLVASPPEMCDVVAFPSEIFRVSVVVYTTVEIEAAAFFSVVDTVKAGRMPQLLLPYSK
jgi:Fe-S-cluster containining protein